jgi:hypothetical protein
MLKDIGKLEWVKLLQNRVARVVNYIRNHQRLLAVTRMKCKKELILPCATRFATNFMVFSRLTELENSLRAVVTCEEWIAFKEDQADSDAANQLETDILDKSFFKEVGRLVKLMKPIVYCLKYVDQAHSTIGKVYMKMVMVSEQVNAVLHCETDKRRQVVCANCFCFIVVNFLQILCYISGLFNFEEAMGCNDEPFALCWSYS